MSRDILFSFDFETTSAVPSTTRVVQAAATGQCLSTGEVLFEMNTLCNPGVDISREAAEVHGISNADVADKLPDAVHVGAMADFLCRHSERVILAGQNIVSFDIPILWRIAGVEPVRMPVVDLSLIHI